MGRVPPCTQHSLPLWPQLRCWDLQRARLMIHLASSGFWRCRSMCERVRVRVSQPQTDRSRECVCVSAGDESRASSFTLDTQTCL